MTHWSIQVEKNEVKWVYVCIFRHIFWLTLSLIHLRSVWAAGWWDTKESRTVTHHQGLMAWQSRPWGQRMVGSISALWHVIFFSSLKHRKAWSCWIGWKVSWFFFYSSSAGLCLDRRLLDSYPHMIYPTAGLIIIWRVLFSLQLWKESQTPGNHKQEITRLCKYHTLCAFMSCFTVI